MNKFLSQEELEQLDYKDMMTNQQRLNAAVDNTLNILRNGPNGGRISKTSDTFLFFIDGPKALSDPKDIKYLAKNFCQSIDKDIRYVEIGTPEENGNGGFHQHCMIVLNKARRFRKRPVFTALDGTVYTINFTEISKYSTNTGDFKYYLNYMRKGEQKPYLQWNVDYLGDNGEQKDLQTKPSYDHDIAAALQMSSFGQANSYLEERHPARYLRDAPYFKNRWIAMHHDELIKKSLQREDLVPFKMEMKEPRMIMAWVWNAIKNPNDRMGNLFIVGPSKMGKSEFVTQNILLRFNCFYISGDQDWTGYDETKNYDFYVFDDMKYVKGNDIELIKALSSSRNHPVHVNIKYGGREVLSKPIIHIVNKPNYKKFIETVIRCHQQEWWFSNMRKVVIEEPLFDMEAYKQLKAKKKSKSSEEPSAMEEEIPQEGFTKEDLESGVKSYNEHHPEDKVDVDESLFIDNTIQPPKTPELEQQDLLDTAMTEQFEKNIESNPDFVKPATPKSSQPVEDTKKPKPPKSDTEEEPSKPVKLSYKQRRNEDLQAKLPEDLFEEVMKQLKEAENEMIEEEDNEDQMDNTSLEEDDYNDLLNAGVEENLEDEPREEDFYQDGTYRGHYIGGKMPGKPYSEIHRQYNKPQMEGGKEIIYD